MGNDLDSAKLTEPRSGTNARCRGKDTEAKIMYQMTQPVDPLDFHPPGSTFKKGPERHGHKALNISQRLDSGCFDCKYDSGKGLKQPGTETVTHIYTA